MFHQEGAGQRGTIGGGRADRMRAAGREPLLDAEQIEDGDQPFQLRREGQPGGFEKREQGGLDMLPIGCDWSDERLQAHETSCEFGVLTVTSTEVSVIPW